MTTKQDDLLLLGSTGLIGSAILKLLDSKSLNAPKREELDLLNQEEVDQYFNKNSFDTVICAAGVTGGILANKKNQSKFMLENLIIQNNVISSAHKYGVKNFIFFASSCIYPISEHAILEESLLTGQIEKTSEGYALAKIAGLKLIEKIRSDFSKNFITLIPPSVFGPNDNFDLDSAHVLSATVARLYKAKKSQDKVYRVWGKGDAKREFLYVDDLAKICLNLLGKIEDLPSYINIGFGQEISVKDLVSIISKTVGYDGNIVFDESKPEGVKRKLLNTEKFNKICNVEKTTLEDGIEKTYQFFLESLDPAK